MTKYVLRHQGEWARTRDVFDYLQNCFNYASFLETPLELGMFTPCDKDGDIFKRPYEDAFAHLITHPLVIQYHEAKKRVIFQFDWDGNENDYRYVKITQAIDSKCTIETLMKDGRDLPLTISKAKELGL